jgi:endonuclease G
MSYSEDFIEGFRLEMPSVIEKHSAIKDTVLLKYTHFSILYSKNRKQPVCAAVNINGEIYKELKRKEEPQSWRFESSISNSEQIGQDFYDLTNGDFHKGHIVRRLDPCWGSVDEARIAAATTFHYTNASPQHRRFNPGIWLELERNILEKGAASFDERITVLAGPVLSQSDRPFIKQVKGQLVLIPSCFWKIVIWRKVDNRVCVIGFMQSQMDWIQNSLKPDKDPLRSKAELDRHFENLMFKGDAVYQVNIADIEKTAGLKFNFSGAHLPIVKDGKSALSKEVESAGKYRGPYRGSDGEFVAIRGLILD